MQKNTLERINLLPQDPFFETTFGRILNWASTIGRYLVIVTEFLIVATIASKFKLDRDLTDLNAAINLRSTLIASYGDLEQTVRSVQDRIDFLRKQDQQTKVAVALDIVKKNLPREAVIKTINIESDSIKFSGRAYTLSALTGVATALQRETRVQRLTLENIRQNKEGLSGYDFDIRMEVKHD